MSFSFPENKELFIRIEYVIQFMLSHFNKIDQYRTTWKSLNQEGLELKVAHEFALFIYLLSRIKDKPERIDVLLSLSTKCLSNFIRTDENFHKILANPRNSSKLGQIHILLTLSGNKDIVWNALIMRLRNKGFGAISEKIINQIFDHNWLHRLLHNEQIYETNESLKPSILNSRCHPVYMSTRELYEYTHTLMYITDFGKEKLQHSTNTNRIKEIISSCMLMQLSHDNFDLLGEFLMNYSYIEDSWDTTSLLCWNYFRNTWDTLGFIPGIAFEPDIYTQLNKSEQGAYAFKELYHTTIVAGILCVNILQSKNRTGKTKIDYPNEYNLCPSTVFRCLNKAIYHYGQIPSKHHIHETNLEILLNDIHNLIHCKSKPTWFESVKQMNKNSDEMKAKLIEMKIMLSIRKRNFTSLTEGLQENLSLNLGFDQTFIEAIEYICLQQLQEGEFLIPDSCIPSILSILNEVSCRLQKENTTLLKTPHRTQSYSHTRV